MKKIQLGGHRKGSKIKGYALVDDEDFEWLNQWKWTNHNTGYARRQAGTKYTQMHTLIMAPSKGFEVDHIDGNKLNNQRINLRICTRTQNMRNRWKQKNNTSGVRGVDWQKNRWRARITVNHKDLVLGYFTEKKEAIKARKEGENKYFKEFKPAHPSN